MYQENEGNVTTTAILPADIYDNLVDHLLANPELINLMECPMTGRFERYTVGDRLGGDFDIWPERHRALLEVFEVPARPAFLVELCPTLAL